MLPSKDITEMISSCLDEAILNENSKRKKRTYLGGSSLGESCSRKIQYRYMGHEADEARAVTLRELDDLITEVDRWVDLGSVLSLDQVLCDRAELVERGGVCVAARAPSEELELAYAEKR